jgi:hypothetical protein
MLTVIPYEEVPHKSVNLPKRKVKLDRFDPEHNYHMVPSKY